MASNVSLFEHPELLADTKELVNNLQAQIRIVEAFERAHQHLSKKLGSNTLNHCRAFTNVVEGLHDTTTFYAELEKLHDDELLFFSLTCDYKRLQFIMTHFRAIHVRTYIRTRKISLSDQKDRIINRLKLYSRKGVVLNLLHKAKPSRQQRGIDETLLPFPCNNFKLTFRDPPNTLQKERNPPHQYEFLLANHKQIHATVGGTVTSSLQTQTYEETNDIQARLSRNRTGDGVMTFDVRDVGWLRRLFDGRGLGVEVDKIEGIFGKDIAAAIDKSDMRVWEKDQGWSARTNCVELGFVVRIRMEPDAMSFVVNQMYHG